MPLSRVEAQAKAVIKYQRFLPVQARFVAGTAKADISPQNYSTIPRLIKQIAADGGWDASTHPPLHEAVITKNIAAKILKTLLGRARADSPAREAILFIAWDTCARWQDRTRNSINRHFPNPAGR